MIRPTCRSNQVDIWVVIGKMREAPPRSLPGSQRLQFDPRPQRRDSESGSAEPEEERSRNCLR